MRAPDELPRRRRRRTSSNRGRILLVVAGVAIFILLTSLRGIAGFYTDYLWFDSLDQWGTRRTILGAQFTLAAIFVTAFFLMAWSNLYVAERLAPPFRPTGPEDELLERYHDLVAGRTGRIRVAVAGLLALIAGVGASAEWNEWLLFRHGGSFGIEDPEFGRDVGFYVFKLPFLAFVVDWLFASLLIVLIITAVEHYLNGGIRVQPPSPRVTPQVKAHLSVLVALLALVKAADYWLQQFELTVSTRGVVDGATYTDVNAQLPALRLLILISLAAAGLFVANIFRRGWALPIVAVALWGFVAVAVGGIYPQIVQNFTVDPNELGKEGQYIERNIEATRAALGVEGVESQEFAPETNPDNVDLASAQSTINNIRLWDPSMNIAGRAFNQLQRIRDYYAMDDIDVDRYTIDGQPTQVEIGVRNIDGESLPSSSWESEHLAYTHGYGAVVAPVNASAQEEPEFVVRDIPVQDTGGGPELEVEQPGIYFGEGLSGYAIVGASGREEIDYQLQGETQRTTYDGEDGVGVGSFFRQAAFALRFGDPDMLLSGYLDGDSKAIYIRDVVDRVEMLAPFLEADHDPYPVVLDGEVKWVVDMYTTTSRYPYAERVDSDALSEQNSLRFGLNYVRNSVKATVDAYDGTVEFYVMDPDDPIIDAYRDALPDLFSDREDMPEGLEEHLRYPEDLFEVQTWTWERYHLDTPSEFLDNNDRWRVARNPGTRTVEAGTATTDGEGGSSDNQDSNRPPTGSSERRIPSYYQLLQLPGEEEAEFVLMRPFVPFSAGDSTQQLTGFMAARMDGENYGKLQVYEMPNDNLPEGPGLVFATIASDPTVSDRQSNLGIQTGGSDVIYGNLLLVPIDDALLYVQPFYVEANTEGSLPRLTFVIAVLGDQVVIEPTLQEALTSMFGQQVSTQEEPGATPPSEEGEGTGEDTGEGTETPSGSTTDRAADLLEEANRLFGEADAALANRDLSTYEEKLEDARAKVEEAMALLTGESPTTTTTTPEASSDTTDGSASPRPA